MQEAFTRPRLEAYQGQIERDHRPHGPDLADGRADAACTPRSRTLSLDVATEIFMGAEPNDETHGLTRRSSTRAGRDRPDPHQVPAAPDPVEQGPGGRKVLDAYFRAQIPAKRASDDDDLFAALCHVETDDGMKFTDDDIVSHMIFLMMAAHDTSTITATAMTYYFAKHPEWQDKARAESLALGTAAADRSTSRQPGVPWTWCSRRRCAWSPRCRRSCGGPPRTPTSSAASSRRDHGRSSPRGRPTSSADHWVNVDDFDPIAYRRPPQRAQGAPVRLRAVRRRRAQVHRHGVRHQRGQGAAAPMLTTFELRDPDGLRDRVGPHLAGDRRPTTSPSRCGRWPVSLEETG